MYWWTYDKNWFLFLYYSFKIYAKNWKKKKLNLNQFYAFSFIIQPLSLFVTLLFQLIYLMDFLKEKIKQKKIQDILIEFKFLIITYKQILINIYIDWSRFQSNHFPYTYMHMFTCICEWKRETKWMKLIRGN